MEPEKRQPGVMLYFDRMRPIFALLSAEERGELVMKMLDYAEHGTKPVLCDRLAAVWPSVCWAIDRDTAAYQKKLERAKKAAQARWEREHGAKQQDGQQSEGRT